MCRRGRLSARPREGRYELEGWRVRKDGTQFWANAVIDAIHDEDGRLIGFAKITRDLTERRQAQLDLESSREQLVQSQKMEAIGHLTGGLAHDFNNMLTGISGSLELMKTRLAQGRFNDFERYITRGAGRCIARRGAHAPAAGLCAPADARSETDQCEQAGRVAWKSWFERTVGPAIQIETVLAIGLWPTLCDPNQLENALLNLCINARDAMPDGGRITIETANTWIDERAARERDMEPGQICRDLRHRHRDGMTPDVIARAFDPFFTTKPRARERASASPWFMASPGSRQGRCAFIRKWAKARRVHLYLPRHPGEVGGEETEPTVGSGAKGRSGRDGAGRR